MARSHQGVVAMVSAITYWDFQYWMDDFLDAEFPLAIALDGVTDVRNLGAICRSAEIFGATHLLLPQKGSAVINEDASKTSAGAIEHLKICRSAQFHKNLLQLKDQEVHLIGADAGGMDVRLWASGQNLRKPTLLIMGSEDTGMNPHVLKLITQKVSITQYGRLDSLNVAVAAGVLLHTLSQWIRSK